MRRGAERQKELLFDNRRVENCKLRIEIHMSILPNDELVTIGSLLKSKFAKMAEEPHVREALILAAWNRIIPKSVQSNVKSIRLLGDTLHVKFESAIIRHTILLNKSKLLEQLRENNCGHKIKELVLS